jgi:hypothetical protein
MAARKRPLSAQDDLAESKRRAKAARTPIAKAVTKQVVEKKERAYGGQAAAGARAETRRGAKRAAGSKVPAPVSSKANVPRSAKRGR